MDRNREVRRTSTSTSIGSSRRRQRNITLRDSPDDDVPLDLQESTRLRDRVCGKKDRDRERDRSSRIKKRRADRLIHGEDSSEDSLNGEEDDDDHVLGRSIGLLPPNPGSFSSISNHLISRKSFPRTKFYRATSLRAADEMIGVSIPRKARSASTKRSHESRAFDGNLGREQVHHQAQVSPSDSNISVRRKMANSPKQCPPKTSSKSSSNQDEIEFEIAEVLYGLRQNQGPSKQDVTGNDYSRFDSRDVDKSIVSSPISNSPSVQPQNSSSSTPPLTVAAKRKKPRPIKREEENPGGHFTARSSPILVSGKTEMDQDTRVELSSRNLDKDSRSVLKNDGVYSSEPAMMGESVIFSDSTGAGESKDNGLRKEKVLFVEKEETQGPRSDDNIGQTNTDTSEIGTQRDEKIQIDLMAPPPTSRASEKEVSNLVPKEIVPINEMKKLPTVMSEVKVDRMIELKVDSEKYDKDHSAQNIQQNQKHHLHHANNCKTAQSNSTLPVPVNGWPGGISPLGWPLHGVLSMDGSTVPSMTPPNPIFTQPRPKRCATHCYIARNIGYHQQFTRINPFWPLGPGTHSICSAKPSSLKPMTSTDVQGNAPAKILNSLQDQHLPIIPVSTANDKASEVSNVTDSAHRKQQLLLPPILPPGAPANILHGPAFIFPMNQPSPATAHAGVRPCSGKTATVPKNVATSGSQNSIPLSNAPAAAALSFGYPNMTPNETQYLTILQNNGYHTFPIPPQVGAPPPYRGAHPHAMPFFYPSQILHPSQIQHHQQNTPPPSQFQVHQNIGVSTGPSNSQKNLQSQSQNQRSASEAHANGSSIGNGNVQSFPAPKNWPLQPTQQQHQQFSQHVSPLSQARLVDTDMAGEGSPSTDEGRLSRANIVYGQNYVLPNFSLMSPSSGTNNHGDKRQSQHGLKGGIELPAQAFAMSFASIGGVSAPPGLDLSSVVQNNARHIMASGAVAQASQQKSYRSSEERKTGASGESCSNVEEERKSIAVKSSSSISQSIAFSRPDLTEPSSVPLRVPVTVTSGSNSQQRTIQQILQLQKQQQSYSSTSAARSKNTQSSNGSDHHLPSGTSKFSTGLSSFPQNRVQSSNGSPNQSPQWKHAPRMGSPSLPVVSAASLKGLSVAQQQMRPHQTHTQISFGGNSTKSPAVSQSANHQSISSPVLVGSPTTSISKGGSTSASTTSKPGQQQAKNAPQVSSSRKSLHMPPCTSVSGTKSPLQQQQASKQALQQASKQALQQAQLFFSNPYAQLPHNANPASMVSGANTGGYYIQRRRPEQQQGSSGTSSAGILSMNPPMSLAGTSDPTKVAPFVSVHSSGNPHVGTGGYPYVQSVSQTVQMKASEQKQPAGE